MTAMLSDVKRSPPGDTLTHARVTRRKLAATVIRMGNPWPHVQFNEYLDLLLSNAGLQDRAELSRLSGVKETQFTNWKKGTNRPSRQSLRKIAQALRMGPDGLARLLYEAGDPDEREGVEPPSGPDLSSIPKIYRELIEFDTDPALPSEARDELRAHLAAVIAGFRARFQSPPRRRQGQ